MPLKKLLSCGLVCTIFLTSISRAEPELAVSSVEGASLTVQELPFAGAAAPYVLATSAVLLVVAGGIYAWNKIKTRNAYVEAAGEVNTRIASGQRPYLDTTKQSMIRLIELERRAAREAGRDIAGLNDEQVAAIIVKRAVQLDKEVRAEAAQ